MAGIQTEVRPEQQGESPPPRRRPLLLVGVVVALLAGLVGAYAVFDSYGPAPEAVPEPSTPRDVDPASAHGLQAERRFIRVGTTNGQQFTDEEFQLLAENFDVVLFTKYHARGDIQASHEAARRLMEMRPDMEIYPYMSTKYWFDDEDDWGVDFNEDWLLRDNDGELIGRFKTRQEERVEVSQYADLANSDYRAWALDVIASWMAAAPYAGISFDAADPIGDFKDADVQRWDELLGPERVQAFNEGMRELLAGSEQLVAPLQVVYNGIGAGERAGPGRNIGLLELTDGALSEGFCSDKAGNLHTDALTEDLALMAERQDKQFLLRTTWKGDDDVKRAQYMRYCLGAFLLGWEPGRSYFQFGSSYTAAQLQESTPDLNVNLGHPLSAYRSEGDLSQREYERGFVYVNRGSEPAVVKASSALTQVAGGEVIGTFAAGDTITVDPTDSAFLLHTPLLAPPGN